MIGLAGVGKSTAGKILKDEYGFIPIAFADSLKDAVAGLFGWPRHLLEGDTVESREFREKPDTFWSEAFGHAVKPRWALQFVGTEVVRQNLIDDFWIRSAFAKMKPGNSYVITDARFPNEFEAIRKAGGFIVEVSNTKDRPEWVQDMAMLVHPVEGLTRDMAQDIADKYKVHASEWEHVYWRLTNPADYVLYNDFVEAQNTASMSMLSASVSHMMRVFTGPSDQKAEKNKPVKLDMVA